MNGLEEYGIKDVGFGYEDTSNVVPFVGELTASGAVFMVVDGRLKGVMYKPRRPNIFQDGAELMITDDTYVWFDEVKET